MPLTCLKRVHNDSSQFFTLLSAYMSLQLHFLYIHFLNSPFPTQLINFFLLSFHCTIFLCLLFVCLSILNYFISSLIKRTITFCFSFLSPQDINLCNFLLCYFPVWLIIILYNLLRLGEGCHKVKVEVKDNISWPEKLNSLFSWFIHILYSIINKSSQDHKYAEINSFAIVALQILSIGHIYIYIIHIVRVFLFLGCFGEMYKSVAFFKLWDFFYIYILNIKIFKM